MEGLNLRVPDLECSESWRLFNNGFEIGASNREKLTQILSQFLDYDIVFT